MRPEQYTDQDLLGELRSFLDATAAAVGQRLDLLDDARGFIGPEVYQAGRAAVVHEVQQNLDASKSYLDFLRTNRVYVGVRNENGLRAAVQNFGFRYDHRCYTAGVTASTGTLMALPLDGNTELFIG